MLTQTKLIEQLTNTALGRINLMPLDASAEPLFITLFSQPQVMRHIHAPLSEAIAKSRFNTLLNQSNSVAQQAAHGSTTLLANSTATKYFLVHTKHEDAIGIAMLMRDADSGAIELGRMLHPNWQGQGLGTELSQLLIIKAISYSQVNKLPLRYLHKRIHQQNLPAIRSANKLGFVQTAALDKNFVRLTLVLPTS